MKDAIIIILGFLSVFAVIVPTAAAEKKAKPSPIRIVKAPKKAAGTISKVKDAATRGFGFGLGREAARQTINGAKKLVKSNAFKSGVAKVKAEAKEIIKKK